jgi:two-component system phosphate regulon response regulator PhoB
MAGVILVVEDDEELNDLLQFNLTQAGHHVLSAWDSASAMEALRNHTPDLMLLDLMLPGADGWEILRALNHTSSQLPIPVIIISAKSDREDIEQARQFSVAGYFIKPFEMAAVLRRVGEVLALKEHSELLCLGHPFAQRLHS